MKKSKAKKSSSDELTYKIIKDYGELENGKRLLKISWNDGPERFEIRKVWEKDGELKVGKGIEITKNDAKKILEYFEFDPKPVDFEDVFKSSMGIMEKRDAGMTTKDGYVVLKRKI